MDLLVSYAWGRFFRAHAEINCAGMDFYPGGVDNWRKFDIDQRNTSRISTIIQTGYAVFSAIVTPRKNRSGTVEDICVSQTNWGRPRVMLSFIGGLDGGDIGPRRVLRDGGGENGKKANMNVMREG